VPIQIRDLSPEELDYVARLCVDPGIPQKWRKEMTPAMDVRKEWLKTMMRKGLRISVALEKGEDVLRSLGARNKKIRELIVCGNVPKGLIEYAPIEFAPEPVKGERSLFMDCVWVLPPFWHGGVAKSLVEKFIEDAKTYGGASVLAYEGDKWFGFFPYMPMSFFKKFGFTEVGRDESRVLLHLDLGADKPPKLIHPRIKRIAKGDKLVVDVFFNSQCPWSRWMVDKVKRNVRRHNAIVNEINTDNRRVIEKYGMSRGVCINGEPVFKRMAPWKEIAPVIKQMLKH